MILSVAKTENSPLRLQFRFHNLSDRPKTSHIPSQTLTFPAGKTKSRVCPERMMTEFDTSTFSKSMVYPILPISSKNLEKQQRKEKEEEKEKEG